MKLPVLSAAALLLAGCTNMVVSDRPLFTQADAKGAPSFRQGVWGSPDAGCAVDLKTPLDTWPKCAHGDVMGPDGPIMPDPAIKAVLAAGDPVIVQLVLPDALREASKDLPGADASVFYGALKPVQTDDRGQVTVFEGWTVQCGPPPSTSLPAGKAEEGDAVQRVTDRPLPGLKMVGDHCLATRPATVRAAAAASRAWQSEPHVTRWIRDGRN